MSVRTIEQPIQWPAFIKADWVEAERQMEKMIQGGAPLAPPERVLVENHPPRDVRAPGHTAEVFDPGTFPRVVEWIVRESKAAGYEALAGSGHSGLLPMAAACYQLGIPMIAVRKADERPKGDSSPVNAVVPHRPFRYALIDDFICSGETVTRIRDYVARFFPQAQCAGAFFYRVPDGRSLLAERCVEGLRIHRRPEREMTPWT